jgi:hypothetical protein
MGELSTRLLGELITQFMGELSASAPLFTQSGASERLYD